jgi:hypothetical protein
MNFKNKLKLHFKLIKKCVQIYFLVRKFNEIDM